MRKEENLTFTYFDNLNFTQIFICNTYIKCKFHFSNAIDVAYILFHIICLMKQHNVFL